MFTIYLLAKQQITRILITVLFWKSFQDTEGRQVGGQQTCSYSQVCCRSSPSSNRYSSGAATGTCGKRNPQGINGRIKSLPYSDGEAEFGEYPW